MTTRWPANASVFFGNRRFGWSLWPVRKPTQRYTLARKGLDLFCQHLVLLVTVAQPAIRSNATAPEGAAVGEGKALVSSSRHAPGALAAQRRREGCGRVNARHALAVAEYSRETSTLDAARGELRLAVMKRLCTLPADSLTGGLDSRCRAERHTHCTV